MVAGYGPEQALLKLEGLIDRFPKARVAVLSIMYENSRRMVNSYRPVYYRFTGISLGLKPFLRDGTLHGLIGGAPFEISRRSYGPPRKRSTATSGPARVRNSPMP